MGSSLPSDRNTKSVGSGHEAFRGCDQKPLEAVITKPADVKVIIYVYEDVKGMMKKYKLSRSWKMLEVVVKRHCHDLRGERNLYEELDNEGYHVGSGVGSIRRIQCLGYGVLGFLGVGTTFDIFQNIHILYLQYGVLVFSGYGVLILFPSWSLVSTGTDTTYLP
ncbi:hypothetical protein Tco_1134487 [Tanacetum coccineum]